MKRTLIFLIALLMAGMTTYLFFKYTKTLNPQAKTASGQTVSVVVAKQAIKKDTQITNQMVAVEQVPKSALQPDALSSIDDVAGKVALIDIKQGEMILSHHILKKDDAVYLAYKVKPGYRAVTVTAEVLAENVANLIQPGDFVDLIFSKGDKTEYLLKNVHVLAVDQRMVQKVFEDSDKLFTMTTLEVTPEEALTIVDREYQIEKDHKAKLTLILRSAIKSSKGE
jgi:pilus assembly protein CpaB